MKQKTNYLFTDCQMAVKLFKNFYIECNAAGRDNLALLPTNMIYKK